MGDSQWPFIGHQQFGQTALRLLTEGTWPSVSLFQGPSHIGKRSIATWIVQWSLCAEKKKPCLQCTSCRAVNEQRHPNVFLLDGEESSISIDAVRTLQQHLHIRHDQSRWIIVNAAEKLTESAANSLLKLLEDPPQNVFFIFITHQPGQIPLTVRSRLSTFMLRPAHHSDVPSEDRQLLAAADGRIGRLETWKKDPSILRQQQEYAEEFCLGLTQHSWKKAPEDIEERLEVEMHILRQLLFQHLGIRRTLPWSIPSELIDRAQQLIPFDRLLDALQRYHQRYNFLNTNVAPRNVYEDLHQRF